MYTDNQQQPVTQPSSAQPVTQPSSAQPVTQPSSQEQDAADGVGPFPSSAAASRNNTAETVQSKLRHLDQWREVLRLPKVRQRLLEDVDPSEITNYFHYMSVGDCQQIESRQRNNGRTAGVEVFLDVLGRLGNPAWPKDLCEAFQDNGQVHLTELLEQEHVRIVQGNVGGKKPYHENLQAGIQAVSRMQYKPKIPKEQLNAMLQFCDLWKATVRREKRLLRDNVVAVDIYDYFPYMSNKVGEKVQATADTQGRASAMDVFIDDGLMYVGGQNWPNDLCFALSHKLNQDFVAQALRRRFVELLESGRASKYKDLDAYLKASGKTFGVDFGEYHSSGMT